MAEDMRSESDFRKVMCWYATRYGQRKASSPTRDGEAGSVKSHEEKATDEGSEIEGPRRKYSSCANVQKRRIKFHLNATVSNRADMSRRSSQMPDLEERFGSRISRHRS